MNEMASLSSYKTLECKKRSMIFSIVSYLKISKSAVTILYVLRVKFLEGSVFLWYTDDNTTIGEER